MVEYAVRGFLLYNMGCTLCPDKSGTRINPSYLQYFEDLNLLEKVPFGTIALAHLYSELNFATKWTVKQISGFLSLLEVSIILFLFMFN